MIRAKFRCEFQPRRVLGGSGHDDDVGAGLLAGNDLRQALLSRSLNKNDGAVADIGLIKRPLDAVGERGRDSGKFGRNTFGQFMDHSIPGEEKILRKPAP